MGFCHSRFRNHARTYSVQVPQTGFETLADLEAPVSFDLRFFVCTCPFEKGRQNLIFSVEPKCDLNIRPTSVHWITVKY